MNWGKRKDGRHYPKKFLGKDSVNPYMKDNKALPNLKTQNDVNSWLASKIARNEINKINARSYPSDISTWKDKGRAIQRERWNKFKNVGANMMPPTGSEPNCPNCRAGWLLGTPPRCSNCNFGWKKKTR
jgi:hypothetical protein